MTGRWWVILLPAMILLIIATPVLADDPGPESDLVLAQRFAPVLYFHPQETFRPQSVDVIVQQARLRRSRRLWFDTTVLLTLDPFDLFRFESDRSHFLDVWYGDEGGSGYANYSAHRAFYEAALKPVAGGPPITVYAHVVRDQAGHVTIQYWMLYFYNDWFNKHEGDWEMVQVMLGPNSQPQWVVLSQHHGGTRRTWDQTPVEEDTHPAVYVALGSHANYFVGDEVYPNSQTIGDRRITIPDRTGKAGRTIPSVVLIPERDRLAEAPGDWPRAVWLTFRGRWGEVAAQGDFSGPLGPADKGDQWERPYAWGMAQPLDTDTWYANRLRVAVATTAPADVEVQLTIQRGDALPAAEAMGNLVILHSDPPAEELAATIDLAPNMRADVIATWPHPQADQVTRFRFADVDFGDTGLARLELGADGAANLLLRCIPGEDVATSGCLASLGPAETRVVETVGDAPDFIWVGDVLPAHRVVAGLLLAVLGSFLPTVLYIGTLYWLDRYEKEPGLLVAAAFLWGSVPALALSLAAEIFFRLPPNLIGSGALEAARVGLIAPLLQEGLKGVAVLFIALRYWREFDNVLDGIIYGAAVGFGFAMTGNLIDYVSAFALWGFEGLTVGTFFEGALLALDHAFYTSLFGASLGLAPLLRGRWRRWATTGAGFVLAVTAHALHNLLAWNPLGINAVRVIATSAGLALIGVVAAWSLERQRRGLQSELKDELPRSLYSTLITPGGRARARWQALRADGLAGWQRTRQLQHRCAELAFAKMEHRHHRDAPGLTEEIGRLRTAIRRLMTGAGDHTA